MVGKLRTCPSVIISGLLLFVLILSFSSLGTAGDPHSAYYGAEDNNLFWFIQTSDTHIGAREAADSDNLRWLVTQARQIISPTFIIVTGDLTDSTNGNLLGYPNGPYQAEWDEYKSIVDPSGITSSDYYDIPGNHDAYNDRTFSYYLNNSVQGRKTGKTQVSFVKEFGFGKYHFMGINTADNTGDSFSLFWPYGDYAGLDASELGFISQEMSLHSDSKLTLVFGHHPLAKTDDSTDTYVYYGLPEFLSLMDQSYAPLYGYGHTHDSSEAFFVPTGAQHEGFYYFNAASLGKSSSNQYTLMAIDSNGLSSKTLTKGAWPAVLITAPVDANLGGYNPYAYSVPAAPSNPIRALVFDSNAVSLVQYRIDGGIQWLNMSQAEGNPYLWKAPWDASSLTGGLHTIEVRATSNSGTSSDIISVNVEASVQVPQIGAAFTEIGQYVTTGTKRNKVTTFVPGSTFYQGDSVVFRLTVKDENNAAVSGAIVQMSISGPSSASLTSSASDGTGQVEVVWTTAAPNKRGTGGTPTGSYTATVTDVTASGYTWNKSDATQTFSLLRKQ